MLYRVARAPAEKRSAHHLELVSDPSAPFVEGNHVFASISSAEEAAGRGVAPEERTMTVSTHVALKELLEAPEAERAARVSRIQQKMRATLEALAPEWCELRHEMTASPRTFERFTGRFGGYVGGIPRRAGLSNYRQLSPRPFAGGLWLAGDSVFPGQSTLAVGLGGVRVAEAIRRSGK